MITDEHFVPHAGLDLEPYLRAKDMTGVHHIIRYLWAIECLGDIEGLDTILDVACGSGYGSYALARRFPEASVIGVDYDGGAVDEAKKLYSAPNLSFRAGDVTRWAESLGPQAFRVIVTFDTIEHVPHREIMMENVVRFLRDDGVLLLSTPCGRDVNDLSPGWVHHKIEYSARSLYDFVKRYFRTVLRPEDRALPHLDVFRRLEGTGVTYQNKLNPILCRDPIKISNPYP